MNFPRTQKLATRHFLAEVARREAVLGRAGDSHMAGPAIEPYLSTLREALNLNRVFDDRPLDHIGVVVGVSPDGVLSAEGNNANRTGLFPRAFFTIEGYVRLPEDA